MTTKWQELENGKNFKQVAIGFLEKDKNKYMTKLETYLNLLNMADNSPEEAGEYFEKVHALEDKIKLVSSFITKFAQTSDWNAAQLVKMELGEDGTVLTNEANVNLANRFFSKS